MSFTLSDTSTQPHSNRNTLTMKTLTQTENTMAFLNERISDENIKKYGIEEIDRKHYHAHFQPEWTVDHERDMYLREVGSGREEYANRQDFTFYWGKTLYLVRLTREGRGVRDGPGQTNWSLISISASQELVDQRNDLVVALKEALSAYKDFGTYSTNTSHVATFTF
jgi:hypothetical protein